MNVPPTEAREACQWLFPQSGMMPPPPHELDTHNERLDLANKSLEANPPVKWTFHIYPIMKIDISFGFKSENWIEALVLSFIPYEAGVKLCKLPQSVISSLENED